jgi:hypothetical protein
MRDALLAASIEFAHGISADGSSFTAGSLGEPMGTACAFELAPSRQLAILRAAKEDVLGAERAIIT